MRIRTLAILLGIATILASTHATAKLGTSPRIAQDINPDPHIVEVNIIAREAIYYYGNATPTKVYTYNGGIPGPTIEANVGDTLVVNFYNELAEPTTIHWHGVELPANMDGSHIAQPLIPAGSSFRYEFKLNRASLFWYHPHVRTNEQVELGLHGALIVHDRRSDRKLNLPRNNREHLLLLDDVLLDDEHQIAEPFPGETILDELNVQVNGRHGEVLLVNGQEQPVVKVQSGRPQRLRMVNVSNARLMRVSIVGHKMWRIGGDGGLLEAPLKIKPIGLVHDVEGGPHGGHDMENGKPRLISDPDLSKGLLLTPGERADVIFVPRGSEPIELQWHDTASGRHNAIYNDDGSIGFEHAHDDGKRPHRTLMTFKPYGKHWKHHRYDYSPPQKLRYIEKIDVSGAGKLVSMFGHTPPDDDGNLTFFAQMKNGKPLPWEMVTTDDAHTAYAGDIKIWEVVNMTGAMHNFHIHGFSFQLIETEFVDMDNPKNNFVVAASMTENKDTILLPARKGAPMKSRTITRLAVHFDDTGREGQIAAEGKIPTEGMSGGWLYHCHILEHSATGMMSFLQVIE